MASRLANPLTIPAEEDFNLFAVMFALTDPTRRAIVEFIAQEPGTGCSGSDFGVSKSALTRHWRVLREVRNHQTGSRRQPAPELASPRRTRPPLPRPDGPCPDASRGVLQPVGTGGKYRSTNLTPPEPKVGGGKRLTASLATAHRLLQRGRWR